MLILDFYVDEPACFGVPPYLSTYCRYVAGALVDAGVGQQDISYLTVDQWRALGKELPTEPELLVVIAGYTVPGKYLGGRIGTVAELLELLRYRGQRQKRGVTLIGGPIRHAPHPLRQEISRQGGILVQGDVEVYAYRLAQSGGNIGQAAAKLFMTGPQVASQNSFQQDSFDCSNFYSGEKRSYEQVDRWAEAGAFLTELHPNFPYLMLELETYRGCTRNIFCSFCTEAFYGRPLFRSLEGIHKEVAALYAAGNRYFRLGRQADLMTYLPNMQDFQNSFPRPIPQSIEQLYAGIRRAAPDLKVLHLDNINPGLIATFPHEARKIAKIINYYNTSGDTAAMGMETTDPKVIRLNDLKCSAEEARQAIEIINECGGGRENGIPRLLPGINLLQGLPGEGEDTFENNYHFLRELLEQGLLLRRINIRRVVSYEKTKLGSFHWGARPSDFGKRGERRRSASAAGSSRRSGSDRQQRWLQKLEQKFFYWRERIRREIDQPMLLRTFPVGTRIEQVIPEALNQGYILGRPLGSYPVTIKIPQGDQVAFAQYQHFRQKNGQQRDKKPLTVVVTGAQERSLSGLSYPLQLHRLDRKAIEKIPGYGRRRATRLFQAQPLNFRELTQALESCPFGTEESYRFAKARE